MKQIMETTDGQFVGMEFDPDEPIVLDGSEFVPDKVQHFPDGSSRYSNSNYVIDVQEV